MKKIALTLTFLFVSTVSAQMPGTAPTFMHVRSTVPEKGHATLVNFIPIPKHVPFVEQINVNGRLVNVTKYKIEYAFEQFEVTYDLSGTRVITPDGKQLPIDEVWKRLKANVIVAVAGDSNTPSQPYLRALNSDTLVIIPPPRKLTPMPKKEAK
jgi:hypothetical protein